MCSTRNLILYLAAAWTFVLLSGCSGDTSTTPVNTEPTNGRGAVISSHFLRSISAQEISTELQQISPFLSAQNNIEIYRISYETIDVFGIKTQASGTIVLPKGLNRAVPIVSYQHGTVVKKSSVPLYTGYNGSFEDLVGAGFAGNGYIAVFPDYLGLGDSPGIHPYVHAKSMASSVIDMLRAAASFCRMKNTLWNGQLFLTGYSEGGFATMAAHREIEESFSSEFSITASAPMAGPYDMSGTMKDLMLSPDPYPYPLYLPYTVYSYMKVYGGFTLEDVFKPEYAAIIPGLFDGSHGYGEVNSAFPNVPSTMFRNEFLAGFITDSTNPLRMALRENDLYRWTPRAPMQMYHCTGDEQVPYRNSELTAQSFKDRGANAELITPGPDMHNPCAQKSLIYAKLWFDSMKK